MAHLLRRSALVAVLALSFVFGVIATAPAFSCGTWPQPPCCPAGQSCSGGGPGGGGGGGKTVEPGSFSTVFDAARSGFAVFLDIAL